MQDRIGIHIGEVIIEERPGAAKPKDLYGIQVDICARVMSLGQGDQILMTRSAFDNARQVLKGRELSDMGPLTWTSHGAYLLQGVDEPLEVCEVGEAGRARLLPPADSGKARRAGTTAPVNASELPPIAESRSANPRPLFLTIAVVAIAALSLALAFNKGWLSAKSSSTALFQCGFESKEGYQAGQSLIDKNGWMRGGWKGELTDSGEGVAENLMPGSAQQAFLGGVAGKMTPGVHASIRRRVLFSPGPDGEAVVEMSWRQRVIDSTNPSRNSFEWLFQNQNGQLLGGLAFNNETGRIMSRRPDNGQADTGLTFQRGKVYPVKLRLDFRAKTWTVTIGNETFGPLSMSDRDKSMNLGQVALTWWSVANDGTPQDRPLTGDNQIAFDDMEIIARDWPG